MISVPDAQTESNSVALSTMAYREMSFLILPTFKTEFYNNFFEIKFCTFYTLVKLGMIKILHFDAFLAGSLIFLFGLFFSEVSQVFLTLF